MDTIVNDLLCIDNKGILVSIIVPIYNVEQYLPQCIESICNQGYKNVEIILVDDASSDSSGKICDFYADEDNRIIVIHKQKNEGLVAARKSGMNLATGDLIGCVDGDDWIEYDMLEVLVEQYIVNNTDLVQCGYVEDGGKNKRYLVKDGVQNFDENNHHEIVLSWLKGEESLLQSQIWTKLYRRSLFQKCYEKVPNHMSLGEDVIFFINLAKELKKVASISRCSYHYRVRNDSMSHRKEGISLLLRDDYLVIYLSSLIRELYPDILDSVIENWVLRKKLWQLKYTIIQYNVNIPFYRFPNANILFGKKIVVYGAGTVGRDYIMQLSEYEQISIVCWVDKNAANYDYEFRTVKEVSYIQSTEWDLIIVAVLDEKIAETIKNDLMKQYGIEEAKIMWDYKKTHDYVK